MFTQPRTQTEPAAVATNKVQVCAENKVVLHRTHTRRLDWGDLHLEQQHHQDWTQRTDSRCNIWPLPGCIVIAAAKSTNSAFLWSVKGHFRTMGSLWCRTGTTEWWTLDSPLTSTDIMIQLEKINRKCHKAQVVIVAVEIKWSKTTLMGQIRWAYNIVGWRTLLWLKYQWTLNQHKI